MKIEPLNSGALRIWMTNVEMCRWGLCFDDMKANTTETACAVRRLLGIARQRFAFHSHGSVLVEALPIMDGCVLVFSVPSDATSFVGVPQLYILETADTVLRFGELLSAIAKPELPPASLYRQGDVYVLILYDGSKAAACHRLLQECGYRLGQGYAAASYVEEHGHVITVGDALQRLSAAYESP